MQNGLSAREVSVYDRRVDEEQLQQESGPRRPNFFVVGAQRCGTTSLSQYLGAHPQIFVSTPKEPFYFSTDFENLRFMDTEEAYLEMFDKAGPAEAVGEATAGYLYSDQALQNIRAFAPDARIIVMLRHPVDLIHSFHSLQLFSFNEDQEDFAKAWESQSERSEGCSLPKRCRTPQFLQYQRVGMLGDQIERLYSIFPKEQVKIIYFEDFVKDTGAAYREAVVFLGLEDDERTEFPKLNENKQPRFRKLMSLVSRRPPWVQKTINGIKGVLGPKGQQLLQRVYSKSNKREKLSPEARAELTKVFVDDIRKLAELTERDLDHWVNPRK